MSEPAHCCSCAAGEDASLTLQQAMASAAEIICHCPDDTDPDLRRAATGVLIAAFDNQSRKQRALALPKLG